jgi:hypothetical protein
MTHSIQTILKRSKVTSTSKQLSLKQYLKKIIQHKIKVAPIIDKTNGKQTVTWMAGKRRVGGDGWTNIVHNEDFVIAPDPVTAVSVLVRRLEDRVK